MPKNKKDKDITNLLSDLDKFDRIVKENLRSLNKEMRYFKSIPIERIDEAILPSLRSMQKSLRQSEMLLTQALAKSVNIQKRI